MMKDNIFSVSRFMNVCRKNTIENWKTNMLRVGLMYGIMAVIFVWGGYLEYKHTSIERDQMVSFALNVFLWFGLICGCISASFTMEDMKSKTSRLSVLMSPATPFEKYFSRWLVSTIVFMLVFIIVYLLADYTRVLVCSMIYPEQYIIPAKLSYLFSSEPHYGFLRYNSDKLDFAFPVYFFMQSCFVLGSSIWPKNSLVKTAAACFGLLVVYGLIFAGLLDLFVNRTSLTSKDFPEASYDAAATFIYIATSILVLFNWTLAYFRFKEAEIINRM